MASPYFSGILKGVGAPITPANLTALQAWHLAEGGAAGNNPFNTTQPFQGATSYNSVGVRNYPTPEAGIQATVQTLQNGRYENILGALKAGNDPRAVGQAIANSPWGTGAGVLRVLGASSSPALQAPGLTSLAQPTISSPLANPIVQRILSSNDALLGIAPPPFPTPTASVAPQPPVQRAREATIAVNTKSTRGLAPPVAEKNIHIIGTPYQGTHAKSFNASGGSDNWESENAVDISAPVGTPVVATTTGVIGPQFGSLGEGGRFAGLRLHLNGGGNEFYYAHLSSYAPGIKPGVLVRKGQVLGYSGEANGVAHLHFASLSSNPLDIFKGYA